MRYPLFPWLLLLLSLPAQARELKPADIITLSNGDIHHGTVIQEYFELHTDFGLLRIPYARMAHLQNHGEDIQIITRNGDRLSGTLQQAQLSIMRLHDPGLPVPVSDIQSIEFGAWPLPRDSQPGADLITFNNGDRLRLRITTDPFMVRHHNGLQLLALARMDSLDIEVKAGINVSGTVYCSMIQIQVTS